MEAINRIVYNNDWLTLLFLGIVFLLVITSIIDKERLKYLFKLPYDNYYILNYPTNFYTGFNTLLFIGSNIILGIFFFLLQNTFYSKKIISNTHSYLYILGLLVVYWVIRLGLGLLVSFLFEIRKQYIQTAYTKMSYFYSSNLYLLILLLFLVYYFNNHLIFVIITSIIYVILLLIRYYHFINLHKKEITTHYFYFILYLCALEIAPMLIVYKIGF